MRFSGAVIFCASLCAVAAVGCGSGERPRSQQTDGQLIMPTGRSRLPTEPYSPVDQPGQLPYDDARAPRDREPTAPQSAASPSPTAVEALETAVPPLARPFDDDSSSRPGTRPAVSSGSYMTIGGVVAEVNSVAIYADKLISDLETDLAAHARDLDEPRFKQYAADQLKKQLGAAINRELLYAAANRLLDARTKEQARYIGEQWKQQQITQRGGGSVEAARRWYAARGQDFDAQVVEAHRDALGKLLLQKEIFPKISVTAAEMRRYYEENREKTYTVRDAARFEMIQVDPVKVGSRELAKQRIDELHAKANDGVDFAKLLPSSNRPALRNSAGELPWVDRGAFALGAVEEAVWKLSPGEVTPVIEEGGKFYIAQLDQKRQGRVLPFEDEETQDKIRNQLWNADFFPLYEKMMDELKSEAIVRTDPTMLQSALEIAMQR
ncbi:MAG: peptidyl-prolyl cis-trans isomerase, partial [Planctomycetota bacterium]|nr:peptidyl-prolyl cis-trans isomerase [Planctomycetota bacterium]